MSSQATLSYRVTGEYYARLNADESGKTIKPYELVIAVPDLGDDKTKTHYMTFIRHNCLTSHLRKQYPDAITYRTYGIVGIDPTAPGVLPASTPAFDKALGVSRIKNANRRALINFIETEKYNVDPDDYTDIASLRNAILRCVHTSADGYPDAFVGSGSDEFIDLDGIPHDDVE